MYFVQAGSPAAVGVVDPHVSRMAQLVEKLGIWEADLESRCVVAGEDLLALGVCSVVLPWSMAVALARRGDVGAKCRCAECVSILRWNSGG